jgi:PAS domain S-box-containing protein
MLKRKLINTATMTAFIVAAASAGDFVINVLLMSRPDQYTPVATALIALVVGAPVSFYLISQRFDVQRAKEELCAMVTDRERAVVESQRRRVEAEAAQATAERALERLRESEARYRQLTDRATDMIIRYDQAGQIQFASPSVRQLGYAPHEMVGRNMAEFGHPEEHAFGLRTRAFITRGGSLAPGRRLEYRARRADGAWAWLEGSPAPIRDETGVYAGAVTVLRDITERRAMEDELRRKQAEAEAAVRVKTDFLANMTHELRTPLNAIIGFSSLLKASADLGPRDARHIALISDASQTLLTIVNDVLDFSKLEAGAVELEIHPFDPVSVAESTVALLAGQAGDKGLTLSMQARGLTGGLLGDSARLRQVLLNFVSNAIKFTPSGDIQVRVSQAGDGAGRRLRIEVEDHGIGVPPDQVELIFGRFTQADASVSRQYGGTGLGLAISKRIIDALGGDIGVISTVGQGSTFWFEVSMATAHIPGETAVASAPAGSIDRALRLLVVDDNAVNRELITALLSPFDLEIETAADGVEAVRAAARTAFDLILMDVQMPNMDGLTATRRIRAAPGAPRTPIIAMTANVLPEQVARCLEAGMDDHLGKPINAARLLEALDRWSGRGPDEAEADAAAG